MKNSKILGVVILPVVVGLIFTAVGCGNRTVQKENEYKEQ